MVWHIFCQLTAKVTSFLLTLSNFLNMAWCLIYLKRNLLKTILHNRKTWISLTHNYRCRLFRILKMRLEIAFQSKIIISEQKFHALSSSSMLLQSRKPKLRSTPINREKLKKQSRSLKNKNHPLRLVPNVLKPSPILLNNLSTILECKNPKGRLVESKKSTVTYDLKKFCTAFTDFVCWILVWFKNAKFVAYSTSSFWA